MRIFDLSLGKGDVAGLKAHWESSVTALEKKHTKHQTFELVECGLFKLAVAHPVSFAK